MSSRTLADRLRICVGEVEELERDRDALYEEREAMRRDLDDLQEELEKWKNPPTDYDDARELVPGVLP